MSTLPAELTDADLRDELGIHYNQEALNLIGADAGKNAGAYVKEHGSENSLGKTLWELAMPFLLYVSLNMAIQAALELCFFKFLQLRSMQSGSWLLLMPLKFQFLQDVS